jgi:hypothetical protein
VADGNDTKTMEAKMPMMAMTTNNSIKVKPLFVVNIEFLAIQRRPL